MPYFLAPFGNQQAFDTAGNPLVGGSWRTFRSGTSTPETTYTSQAGTTQQGVIMTLDSMGLPANGPVWMLGGQALKFRLLNAAGVLLDEWDNITGIGDVNVAPDEWVLFAAAPTYLSATVFTVAGDQTNIFQVRRRVKTTNTGGAVYSTIVSSVFAVDKTTVTVLNTFGVLAVGLSAVSYSLLSAVNGSVPIQPERTSNASGEALRFSDGLQICTGTFPNLVMGINAIVAPPIQSFALPFVGLIPVVSVQLNIGVSSDFFGCIYEEATSLTQVRPVFRNGATAQTISNIRYSAIGRWF